MLFTMIVKIVNFLQIILYMLNINSYGFVLMLMKVMCICSEFCFANQLYLMHLYDSFSESHLLEFYMNIEL